VKRVWPLLAIGAAAYLLVMVVTFPAARLVPLLERQVAGLSLYSVAGSVFSGQAAQLVYQGLDFGHLTWQVRPAGLLLGRLEFHIELTNPANPGYADIAITPWGNLYGRDIRLMLSPDRLVNHYSPVPVKTSGAVQLQIETFKMSGGFPQDVTGLLNWEDGVVLDPIEIILGDVGMTLSSKEDLLVGSIVEGGRLEAMGDIQLSADGSYQVNLQIMPDNEMSDETLAALETVGQMQSDSSLLFRTAGRL
jgi:general secretion pathway protein N